MINGSHKGKIKESLRTIAGRKVDRSQEIEIQIPNLPSGACDDSVLANQSSHANTVDGLDFATAAASRRAVSHFGV